MTVVQDDVLRVTAEMSISGNALQNVLHWQLTSASSVTDAQALLDCGVFMESLYTEVRAQMNDAVLFDQIRVQNITQDVLLGVTDWPTISTGGSTVAALPLPVAALITFPTTVPQTRGGIYLAGFTELENTSGGALATSLLTTLAAFAVEALAIQVVGSNSYQYVLINREFGTVIPFVSSIVHTVWRTQRRRRQGVGV